MSEKHGSGPDSGFAAPCAPSSRQAGFTLLELLVVLAICAIAVGAVASLQSRRPVSLRVLAANLVTDLNAARETAIGLDRPVQLLIGANGTTYAVSSRRAGVQLPGNVRLAYVGAPGIGRTGAQAHLEFYGDGSSTGGTLVLSDGRGMVALQVALLSGAVTIAGAPP